MAKAATTRTRAPAKPVSGTAKEFGNGLGQVLKSFFAPRDKAIEAAAKAAADATTATADLTTRVGALEARPPFPLSELDQFLQGVEEGLK